MHGVCPEQVQEVVLSADIRCAECQKRVADIMARMNGEISVRPSIDYAWILNTKEINFSYPFWRKICHCWKFFMYWVGGLEGKAHN
jgi:hypothetical protein